MAFTTKSLGRELPTYKVSTFDFFDVEHLNSLPCEIFTSKRFHSLKAVFGTFLYTFELSLLDLDENEDPEIAVAEGTLLPLGRVPISPERCDESEQFPPPLSFRDFFSDYEHNGFILSGDDLEKEPYGLEKISTEVEVYIDFDLIVKQLHSEGKIDIFPTKSWFARDQRRFSFSGSPGDHDSEDSGASEDSYDFDCLGTTACQLVTDRVCDLYLYRGL